MRGTSADFWQNLIAGRDCITQLSDEQLAASGYDPAKVRALPGYVAARGLIEKPEWFDAAFFGVSPKEAEVIDPQQRLFLEIAWDALEDAACDPSRYAGLIGVFGGLTNNTYFPHFVRHRRDLLEAVGTATAVLANEKDFLATRLAYKLDLHGPALNIQTACSSSLVAVCTAVQSLLSYQCDTAIAGGVSVTFPQERGYFYNEGAMTSSDGRCAPFDAAASGTVFSSGAGVVILKRLADALAEGDQIYAVIRGAALNNDGGKKVSFAAPSVDGHSEVIALAQAVAGITPDTISYLETHGTGTPLGDPIEIAGLNQVFASAPIAKQSIPIGSAKGNIGHLDAASGVVGLIKTALALKHGQIPPSLNFTTPNPALHLEDSPFFVNTELRDWPRGSEPRRAGVSSFGVGGTNAHVVLEEAPLPVVRREDFNRETRGKIAEDAKRETEDGASELSRVSRSFRVFRDKNPGAEASDSADLTEPQTLVLSAKTATALDQRALDLAAFLEDNPTAPLADVAFTLQVGRQRFAHRRVVVARTATEAIEALRKPSRLQRHEDRQDTPVAFLFPGQGAQYAAMGAQLYRTECAFRDALDEVATALEPELKLDLREVLFSTAPDAAERLRETRLTQPAIFAVDYALGRLWLSLGIEPAALLGHSVGEFAAATLAGVFSVADAARLVATRARLVNELPAGAMLAVRVGEAEARELLTAELSIAAVNSPKLCVISGPLNAIAALEAVCDERKIAARRLATSHAFHSAMVASVVEPFAAAVAAVKLNPPTLPIVSSATGDWLTDAQATDPRYWATHLRATVRFADAVGRLLDDRGLTLLEAGPGQTLTQLARQHTAHNARHGIVHTIAEDTDEEAALATALGALWLGGAAIDWSRLHGSDTRRRVSLPTYPFERQRYFADLPAGQRPPYVTNITDGEPPLEAESLAVGRRSAGAETEAANAAQPMSDGADGAAPYSVVAAPVVVPSSEAAPAAVPMLEQIRTIISDLSGQDLTGAPADLGFLELGFDSLFLSQAAITLTRRFGCKVTFRQLLKELSNLQALADFIDANATKKPGAPAAGATPATGGPRSVGAHTPPATHPGADGAAPSKTAAPAVHGPFRPVVRELATALTQQQEQWIQDFIVRYVARTPKSKEHTQEYRKVLADPRAVSGFKQVWKEMIYPIVVGRSKGARLWDVDGNEWLDITLAFGAAMLGHQPDFVIEACKQQMDIGIEIGPTSPLAGEVAQMLCDRTGMDRVTFCNTGSEAVTGALRVARTVTGKPLIVYFSGGYHGIDNEALGHRTNSDAAVPIAPGITPEALANALIFDYGDPRSLEQIIERADDIAAVLVEPVQSRRPGFQPREFLHELRAITQQHSIALIFDEVVTGFRCHPGGAQAYFGIKADLASYGKILGGGISIGAIAGRAEYMDAFDGGQWQFGDDSFPEAAVTFFAGTFVRWPLALAAAKAVLLHLEKEGPALQQTIATRADDLIRRINEVCAGSPFTVRNFTSNWYIHIAPEFKYGPIFYALMRHRGIHVWEGRPCFVSTVHTAADLDRVVEAFRDTVAELEQAGFFIRQKSDAPAGADTFPTSEGQREMWLVCQQDPIGSVAYNETWTLRLTGEFDLTAFRAAAQTVVDRHDALRATITPSGERLVIAPTLNLDVPLTDLSALTEAERAVRFAALREAESTRIFDLQRGPLVAFQIVKLAEREHAFLFNAHHLTCDGWSCDVLLNELAAIYTARRRGTPHGLPAPMQMRDYEKWEVAMRGSSEFAEDKAYWLDQYKTIPPELTLPGDRPHPRRRSYRGSAEEITLPTEWMAPIAKLGSDRGATFFAVLLAGYKTLLFRLTGQTDLAVGMPSAGQNLVEGENLIGHCVNLLPVRTQFRADSTFSDLLAAVQTAVLEGFEHQRMTFGTLLQSLVMPRTPGRVPLVPVTFNLDPPLSHIAFDGLEYRFENNPRAAFQFDFGFNCDTSGGGFRIVCKYSTDLFDAATVRRWMDHFREVLEAAAANPQQPLGAFLPQLSAPAKISATPELDLAAVEAALKKSTAVKDAAVVVRESANGDPEIVAHVVPGEHTPVMCWVSSPSAGGELFYDDVLYNAMAHDKSRHDLYRRAFAKSVKDKVVVDVGTGRDAILARFCVEFGAKKVYGIEILQEPAEQARHLIDSLGLSDKIFVIHGRSQDVHLPELADICISENIGHIGGAEGGDLMIIDSRRFLKPGGEILPKCCSTKIAAATMPQDFIESPGFEALGAHYARMAWESAGYKFDMRLGVMGTDRSFLASGEAIFEAIDFNQPPVAEYQRELTLTIHRDGVVHGFLLWLRLECADDIFLEGIDAQDAWLPIFMPVFDQGVDLRAGDVIHATAGGQLAANKTNRDYRIRGHVARRDGTRLDFDYDSPHYRELYKHTPFYERLFADDAIRVTAKQKDGPETAINAALQKLLPPGTPARVALCEALPTTSSGELDRDRLIAPKRGLSDADRQRVLVEWNANARPFPADRGIHRLFEEQAVRRPDAVAIVDGPTRVTYQELNERANRLARKLGQLGVTRGTCVGVCAERSAEFLTSILAILKAGGAYVPIDPTYPADRIAQMLNATRTPLILTRGNGTQTLANSGARLIALESLDFASGDPSNLAEPGAGEELAYVMFTSGSTGTPKAVAIPHRAIARLVVNTDYAPLTPTDVVAFASNVCFDATTFEIWGPLLNGGTTVVTPQDVLLSPAALRAHFDAHGISAIFLTTSLFNRLAQDTPDIFRPLRFVLWGGEAADPDSVRRVLEHGRPQHLLHVYGPTETTTFATWHEVESVTGNVVPIGRGIANTSIYLLDPQQQPVALGATGELCIGGPGVALGYLNQPQFTAERFVETEFGRVYKSGDLARWLPSGALEFVGRVDEQVKVRGFRIEPGEIENVLRSHASIAEARVIVRKHNATGKQLAGYVTARAGASVPLDKLHAYLSQRLPDYMVPSAFAVLAQLPLTPNGKLDIRALPEPEPIGAPQSAHTAPRNPIETAIAALWQEVLGRDSLSVHEDFFMVGGHSILAIRMLSRIREKLSVDVPVARLFETPTIAGLAEFVAENTGPVTPGSAESLVMIQKGDDRRRPLYLVPGGWGGEIEFLVYAELVRNMDRSLPLYGLRARTSNNDKLPPKTVEEFAAAFVQDIMRFQPQGPYMLGGECVGGVLAYEMARQFEEAGQRVSLVLLLDTEWPSAQGLQEFHEWESQRHEKEAAIHRHSLGEHFRAARKLSPAGILRYAWRHFRPGALERQMAGFVAERDCFTAWPRLLLAHQLQPHTGRVTLLQDEVSSRSPMLAAWKQHHAGEIDVQIVSGDHASYIREHAAEAAAKIREIIDLASPTDHAHRH